jgi:glycosyltransferase involved in cell wall biosynthesis
MAQNPCTDITVAYCSLQGAESTLDSEFGLKIQWDIPLLDGYPWIQVKNYSPKAKLGSFWGLVNFGLFPLIMKNEFDAVIIYTGYIYASFWITMLACKLSQTPIMFGADAHSIEPRDRRNWKVPIKKIVLPWIFGLADLVIAPSSGTYDFISSLGIPKDRICRNCYTVDNDWWLAQSQMVDRTLVRNQWEIPDDASVVLFCGKLQPWKRPQDALRAFAQADIPDSYLVIAGDGPMRTELEDEAKQLNISDKIRFLGFVNQSQLPSVYTSSDLFVFPSAYEPFGVVVNEAMLCGWPVVTSDRVGARVDLVIPDQTGKVYSHANSAELASILQELLPDRERLKDMSKKALQRMETWSPQTEVENLLKSLSQVT